MIAVVTDVTDPFDLDVSIIEGGEGIDVLLMSTDNGCSSTCPDACTGSGVAQMR
ncbi:MAG: FxLD family lanthipeptide [Pseudonocardiaceae bacterium]